MNKHQYRSATYRTSRRRNTRSNVAVGLASAVAVVVAYGWSQHVPGRGDSPVTTTPGAVVVAIPTSPASSSAAHPSPLPGIDELSASFDELSQQIGAQIGLAYAPLDDPDQIGVIGSWLTGPAWSTIKVPLALALLRDGVSVNSTMRSAITSSDNAAAESIWEELGGGPVAAGKVQAVLAEAGDPLTVVPSERRRAEFSVFGQTDWSLTDQARFLARVACDVGAAPVTDLMGEIVPGQRWGLGTIENTYFKGGWGPGIDGLYLVRQLGVVPTRTGQVAVAVAAVSDSGGFGDGTAALDRVAGWLKDHLGELGGGPCPSG